MNADSLALPNMEPPQAWKEQGMRVVYWYNINRDSWIVRCDTVISGLQHNCGFEASVCFLQDHGTTARQFADMCVEEAKSAFLEGRSKIGTQLYILKQEMNYGGRNA